MALFSEGRKWRGLVKLEPSRMEAGVLRGGLGRRSTNQQRYGKSDPLPSPPETDTYDRPKEEGLEALQPPGCRKAAWKVAYCVVRKLGDGKREVV